MGETTIKMDIACGDCGDVNTLHITPGKVTGVLPCPVCESRFFVVNSIETDHPVPRAPGSIEIGPVSFSDMLAKETAHLRATIKRQGDLLGKYGSRLDRARRERGALKKAVGEIANSSAWPGGLVGDGLASIVENRGLRRDLSEMGRTIADLQAQIERERNDHALEAEKWVGACEAEEARANHLYTRLTGEECEVKKLKRTIDELKANPPLAVTNASDGEIRAGAAVFQVKSAKTVRLEAENERLKADLALTEESLRKATTRARKLSDKAADAWESLSELFE